ncbi:uncharacterized protein T551_00122 [Pneumocystis jirovecii RU7]|uniref:UBA domain-containing protein n=1 Tax=Pneumocystis jirovecii (strain RU7) TaxID=1408657 RepID=A0A0W4ZW89_PNEJ7|nr:uncharacterized protein T551_00122 [Pneumocystis jirovecii RU7]KTW32637.1 hypothetical protein T551_00122 [Pneumocystis jirovecii RU7]
MNTEIQRSARLNVQEKNAMGENTLKGKKYEEIWTETEEVSKGKISSFYDTSSDFYQDISLLSFESTCKPSITEKESSNEFTYEHKRIEDKTLLSLNNSFCRKTKTSDSSFDVSFLDQLSILNDSTNNKTAVENNESQEDDLFEVFNRPVQDFIENNIFNDNCSYLQQDNLLLNSQKSNEFESLEDEIVMQLIDMGFNYEQVIKAMEMTEKKDIDSIISLLMTLNFLDDEKKQKGSQKNYIVNNRKESYPVSDSHLSPNLFDKANTIFNQGKLYFQKTIQNSGTNSNIYSSLLKMPKWMKHKSSLSNQKLPEEKRKFNETTHKTSVQNIENYNFLDFSSDEPVKIPSSTQPFESFKEDIITQEHRDHFENFEYNSKNFIEHTHSEPICKNLFFQNVSFSSDPKPEYIKQPDLFTSSSLIHQLNIKRELASDAFNNGNYSKALEIYTEAIEHLPSGHVLKILFLANRSLCYLRMGNSEACLLDCNKALKFIAEKKDIQENVLFGKNINHIWKKIIIRRAQTLQQLERFEEARCQWEEIINANIGYSKALDAKHYCERALNSNILIDINPLENFENQTSKNIRETSCKNLDKKDTLFVSTETRALKKTHINTLDSENEKKVFLYDKVEQHVSKWVNGKENNLRALISTLDQVLWASLGWESISMANLLSTLQVKKAYIKAISKIHPDKLPRNTSLEQKMIASSIFNFLNHAWNTFKKQNNI